jgi:hypothetical protein
MKIVEYQWCNTQHDCETDTGRCNTPIREYMLPEEQRASWHDFFGWLTIEGVIQGFSIL